MALISELGAEDRGQRRERLFVWELSPELKRAESLKQLMMLGLMIAVLTIAALMRIYDFKISDLFHSREYGKR